jgi:hypothetical protein
MISEKTARFAKSRVGEATYVVMHPAQMMCVLATLSICAACAGNIKEGEDPKTFYGLKVVEDKYFPLTMIEFRNEKHEAVCQIKNLALPSAVFNYERSKTGEQQSSPR